MITMTRLTPASPPGHQPRHAGLKTQLDQHRQAEHNLLIYMYLNLIVTGRRIVTVDARNQRTLEAGSHRNQPRWSQHGREDSDDGSPQRIH